MADPPPTPFSSLHNRSQRRRGGGGGDGKDSSGVDDSAMTISPLSTSFSPTTPGAKKTRLQELRIRSTKTMRGPATSSASQNNSSGSSPNESTSSSNHHQTKKPPPPRGVTRFRAPLPQWAQYFVRSASSSHDDDDESSDTNHDENQPHRSRHANMNDDDDVEAGPAARSKQPSRLSLASAIQSPGVNHHHPIVTSPVDDNDSDDSDLSHLNSPRTRLVLDPLAPLDPQADALQQACCESCDVAELVASATLTPQAFSCAGGGPTALHVLARNRALAATCCRKQEEDQDDADYKALEAFCVTLFDAYPAAMLTSVDGKIPFEDVLGKWARVQKHGSLNASMSSPSSRMKLWSATAKWQHNHYASTRSQLTKWSQVVSSRLHREEKDNPETRLTPIVIMAIRLVSALLQHLEEQEEVPMPLLGSPVPKDSDSTAATLHRATVQDWGTEMIQSLAAIPDLVLALLLLEPRDREMIGDSLLVRKLLVHPAAVGPWLTKALQDPTLQHAAMDYLQSASESYNNKSTSSEDTNEDLEIAVSRLPEFCPSLLQLSAHDLEQTSCGRLVGKVLDRLVARPFAVTAICFDALFLTLTVAGFRAAVHRMLVGRGNAMACVYLAQTGIFYFVLRELGKTVSLWGQRDACKRWFSFWNLTDCATVVLVLASVLVMRSALPNQGNASPPPMRPLLAITTGFLWLRVLSFLKGINMQLATFVLAILQIARDILWFCVILLTLVVSFAQMFFTLLVPASCATPEAGDKECSQAEYYLAVYAILLGDFGTFDRDQFHSPFAIFLAVMFTFLVVLVLLNVLIAVSSDSYEKCLVRSRFLFGRARVMMMAELVSFQDLLRPRKPDSQRSRWFWSLSAVVVAYWTFAEVVGQWSARRSSSLALRGTSIIVLVGLYVLLRRLVSGEPTAAQEGWSRVLQSFVLSILGSSADTTAEDADHWQGRLVFLQKELSRIDVDARRHVEQQVAQLERRLKEQQQTHWQEEKSAGGLQRDSSSRQSSDASTQKRMPTPMPPVAAPPAANPSTDAILEALLKLQHTVDALSAARPPPPPPLATTGETTSISPAIPSSVIASKPFDLCGSGC